MINEADLFEENGLANIVEMYDPYTLATRDARLKLWAKRVLPISYQCTDVLRQANLNEYPITDIFVGSDTLNSF